MGKTPQKFTQERSGLPEHLASPARVLAAVVLLATCGGAWGQDTLALSSAAATAGGTVTLNLTLNAPGTPQPAGVQWTLAYSTADFASISVAAGPAATAASKSVSCNAGSGSYDCLLIGLNENTIGSGVIATVTLVVSSSTTDTSSLVQITQPSATDAAGNPLAVTATGGTVSVSQPYTLTAMTCSPNPLTTPGTASCSVTASAPAAAGGLTVALGIAGGAASVSVPASVTIAQGAASAAFSATAAAVSATTTVTLVASLNGTSQSVSLQLAPPPPPPPPPAAPPTVSSLACSPTTLASHASAVCTVTLSAAAPSGGSTVLISVTRKAPLTVPASATVPGGSTSASFSVLAGSISSNQTVTLKASLNGTSAGCSLSLTAPTSTKHHH